MPYQNWTGYQWVSAHIWEQGWMDDDPNPVWTGVGLDWNPNGGGWGPQWNVDQANGWDEDHVNPNHDDNNTVIRIDFPGFSAEDNNAFAQILWGCHSIEEYSQRLDELIDVIVSAHGFMFSY